jgi:hypothetical protein
VRKARRFLAVSLVATAALLAGCDDSGQSFRERVAARERTATQGQGETTRSPFVERVRAMRERRGEPFGGRSAGAARGGGLLAHRASYVVEPSGYRTPIYDFAEGTLQIDLIEDCDGWTLQERLTVDLAKPEGGVPQSSILYRATEQAEQRLTFSYSRRQPGDEADVIGEVYPEGRLLFANFTAPQRGEIDLPQGTIFPISHLRQVVAAARRGRPELDEIVFDGANLEPYRAHTVIRAPVRPSDDDPRLPDIERLLDRTGSDVLPRGRIFPVHIAYYSILEPFAPPVLEREMLLHESGVIVGMHIDFGDLRMDAKLAHLERQGPVDCRPRAFPSE